MNWGIGIRGLAYLKRATLALESLAEDSRIRLRMEQQEFAKRNPTRRQSRTEIDVLDQSEANKRWKEQQTAQMIEDGD